MDRLRRLVFSFYREDPEIEAELEPLRDCRMSRGWGCIRIECMDGKHLEEVSGLMSHLRRPLLAMGLGRQIVLRVPGRPQRAYPCLLYTSPSPRDVEESRMPSSA